MSSSFLKYTSSGLCFIGVLLSLYAVHVEINKEKNNYYEAFCDISEHMSCSKVFTSSYGKGFGFIGKLLGNDSIFNIPNPIYGIIFYGLLMVLGEVDNSRVNNLQLLMAILSNIASGYLAYILYFILQDFCVVCVSTYLVNAGLLVCYILQRSTFANIDKFKKKK